MLLWASFGLTVALGTAIWAATQALRAVCSSPSRSGGKGLGRPSLGLLRETISFGVRAWVGTLADSLGFRIDQILLALIASETALGFYVVAVNLSEILLYFPGAVSTALLPLAARSEAGPRLDQTLRAYRSATYVTLASIVLSAALVPPLIPLVFGASFHASVTPFLLLLPGLIGFTAMIVFCNALIASSLPGPVVDPAGSVLRRRDRARLRADSRSSEPPAQRPRRAPATCAAGACAIVIYRARAPFHLLELVVPQSGDFAVLRTLAPVPRASLADEARNESRPLHEAPRR